MWVSQVRLPVVLDLLTAASAGGDAGSVQRSPPAAAKVDRREPPHRKRRFRTRVRLSWKAMVRWAAEAEAEAALRREPAQEESGGSCGRHPLLRTAVTLDPRL
mmetsp:Transcript_15075/g.24568  ORF Transcript_15075/g.24568 Transcript_15075/m.24568 type:complete len:103 (-) Transcript_15075:22-330(-)